MKFLKITSTILTLLTLTACNNKTQSNSDTSNATYEPSPLYKEYPFDSGDDVDLGFTKRALEQLKSKENLLSEGSTVVEDKSMKYIRVTVEENEGASMHFKFKDFINSLISS